MKKKNNSGKNKSLFGRLIKSYILFCIITVFSFMLCISASVFEFAGGGFSDENIAGPAELKFDEEGRILNIPMIEKMSGWVEKLDENLNVIQVFGEKKTENLKYTMEELLDITADSGCMEYYAYCIKHNENRYLAFYDRNSYNVVYSLNYQLVLETPLGKVSGAAFLIILAADILCISLYLSKKIKRPLNNMINEMQDISSRESLLGFFPEKPEVPMDREFLKIQKAFYGMVDSLKKQQEENEALRKSRNRMLLDLSHDIKTPVATIKSTAFALKEGLVVEEDLKKYYGIIAAKAERVNLLTEDLFTMLKLESTDYAVELKKMDLAEFARKVCAEHYMEITNAGLLFEADIPEGMVYVNGDEKLLARVLGNLLKNAEKYNQKGREVKVSLIENEDSVRILVEDDGEGIPKETSSKIFQAFVRGERERSTRGGTGLGLSIAAAVMERHKGKLSYEYKNERNVFIMQFPVF